MKKMIATLLAALMMLCVLAGCGESKETANPENSASAAPTEIAELEEDPANTTPEGAENADYETDAEAAAPTDEAPVGIE